MTEADFMRLAIEAAWQGIEKGEMPFGACIAKNGQVVSVVHNTAKSDVDMTAHAEVQAIREANRRLRALELTGCVIYSTCEPCPMCFSACVLVQDRKGCVRLSDRGCRESWHEANSHLVRSHEPTGAERCGSGRGCPS